MLNIWHAAAAREYSPRFEKSCSDYERRFAQDGYLALPGLELSPPQAAPTTAPGGSMGRHLMRSVPEHYTSTAGAQQQMAADHRLELAHEGAAQMPTKLLQDTPVGPDARTSSYVMQALRQIAWGTVFGDSRQAARRNILQQQQQQQQSPAIAAQPPAVVSVQLRIDTVASQAGQVAERLQGVVSDNTLMEGLLQVCSESWTMHLCTSATHDRALTSVHSE